MQQWKFGAALGACAILLTGCTTAPSGPAGDVPALEGKTFMWAEGANSECEIPPTIAFEKDRVSGNGGCNSFTGGYKLEGKAISFTNFAMTMRMCGPAFMDVEQRFTAALGKARFATAEGENVTLWGEDMQPVLKLVPERPGRCD